MNPRVLTATALVAAVHVVLLAVILTLRHEPVQPALESRVMTAQLLPPAPVAAPAAVQSVAPPPTPAPPIRSKSKVQPKPAQKPAPAPLREAPAPVVAAQPAPPTPATPATPAIGRQTMDIAAPKNVSHLDCNIVKPDYPALSRRRGETGTAYVKFVVGLTGKLENIELKKSSGFSRLDDAALAAAHASACKPYLEDGQPVRAAYTQPYNFNLED
ncbi:MAG: putative TonB-dependent receptor [uncultured Paraburkholderia sp.]|nr:MAG: putative TonB-dependent receptor [uncultured Paraburkholderia sp.]